VFPSGVITFSVRSPTGCSSQYDVSLWYNRWVCEKDVPELLYDPPLINRLIPELGQLFWMYPADPAVINQAFVGQAADPLPEQRLIFHWDQSQDFLATFNIEGAGNLDATLYDAGGSPIAGTGLVVCAPVTSSKQISVTNLPAGWYAMEIGNGDFATYFDVTFNVQIRSIYLPVVLRAHP
jgi:hypothetical protein